MKDRVDTMCGELGIALREIVVSGGGAGSSLLMQIFADAFGIPSSRATGPIGRVSAPPSAPRSQRVFTRTFRLPWRKWPSPPDIRPESRECDVYCRMNAAVYREIRNATDPIFERSYPIFQ